MKTHQHFQFQATGIYCHPPPTIQALTGQYQVMKVVNNLLNTTLLYFFEGGSWHWEDTTRENGSKRRSLPDIFSWEQKSWHEHEWQATNFRLFQQKPCIFDWEMNSTFDFCLSNF